MRARQATAATAPPTLRLVETKHEKFRRIGNDRAKRLIKRMILMGNLGSADYEATPEELDRLVRVLQDQFNRMVVRLKERGKSEEIADIL